MNKFIKTASKAAAGVATFATLSAGKAVMALTSYSVRDGVETAKTDEMPSTLIGDGGIINKVTSIILYVLGIISVIMLIIGGVKYATSAGDAKAVTDAKNTILYALIGLVIALLAYAIVEFVLGVIS